MNKRRWQTIKKLFGCRWVSREGSILILAMWTLVFLGFFAVTMGGLARQKLMLMDRLGRRAQLQWVSEAGIARGIAELKKPDMDLSSDSLLESWANQEDAFRDIRLDRGCFSVKYSYWDEAQGLFVNRFGVLDEEGKINVNRVSLEVMSRLFANLLNLDVERADEIASSFIDWRDADSDPLLLGAEDNYYAGLKQPYECKDAPFSIFDELLLVKGVTATIYNVIKDHITFFGSGAVNINTASRVVLLACGLDDVVVGKVLSFRAGEDGVEATEDDRFFQNTASIVSDLSQVESLSAGEVAQLSNVVSSRLLKTSSQYFRITSYGVLDGADEERVVMCVVNRVPIEDGEGFVGQVVYWRVY